MFARLDGVGYVASDVAQELDYSAQTAAKAVVTVYLGHAPQSGCCDAGLGRDDVCIRGNATKLIIMCFCSVAALSVK